MGIIVGGVIGGVLVIGVGLIAIVIWFFVRGRKKPDAGRDIGPYRGPIPSYPDRDPSTVQEQAEVDTVSNTAPLSFHSLEQTETGSVPATAPPSYHSQSPSYSYPAGNPIGTSGSSSTALGRMSLSREPETTMERSVYEDNEGYDGYQERGNVIPHHRSFRSDATDDDLQRLISSC